MLGDFLMVIGLVSQGHTLLPEHPVPLPVDVQASLDGIGGGLLPEDAAHAVEQLEDTSGGIRMGYRPMCLCTLMVRGLLLWVMGQTMVRLLTRLNKLLLITKAGRRPFCSWPDWGSKSR